MYRNIFFKSITALAMVTLIFSQFKVVEAGKLDFGGHSDDNFWTVNTLYCKDGISITARQTTLDVDHKAFWLELGSSSIPVTVTPGVDPSARIGYGDGTKLVNDGNVFTVFFYFTALQTPGASITTQIWRWDHGNQTTNETGGAEDDGTLFDDILSDTDVVGNCFIDQTPPTTSITQNPPEYTNSSSATFSFSGTDNSTATGNLTYQCYLDTDGWQSCTSPVTFTGLAVGSHQIWISAFDQAGNYDSNYAYYSWTVDTTLPVVSTSVRANPDLSAAASVNFTVTFSEPVTGVGIVDFALTTSSGISGASITTVNGSGAAYTVTVNTGSGNGTIRLDIPISATITDLATNPLASLPYTGGETYTINKTRTFTSIAANDGWVLESGENTNKGGTKNSTASTFNLGDDAANRQYLGILHFDTSLPGGAVVTSATLSIRKKGQVGNVNLFTKFGGLFVDVKMPSFGTPALAISDFQAAGTKNITKFGNTPASGWYNALIGSAFINTTGTTQFRLRFKLDDNHDFLANYIQFYSGNAPAASRPQLIVQYYVP